MNSSNDLQKKIKLVNKKLDKITESTNSSYRDYGLLRPGSKLYGYQKNNANVYNVEIKIIDIDYNNSFICGELIISGIVNYMENIITYFEGEIINKKQNFSSKHFGVDFDTDYNHWMKFDEFKEFCKNFTDTDTETYLDTDQKSNNFIFMRWKEQYYTHDHKIKHMNGVDINGFYYICFNKLKENIIGYYYGDYTEKFEKLYLEFDKNDYLKKGSENFNFR